VVSYRFLYFLTLFRGIDGLVRCREVCAMFEYRKLDFEMDR
jgi:hypothetical protein